MREVRTNTPAVLVNVDGRWWWESLVTLDGEPVRVLSSAGNGQFPLRQLFTKIVEPSLGRVPPVDYDGG
jgi:hypothetical protein